MDERLERRALLTTAGAGAVAWLAALPAAAQSTEAEQANVKLVNDFCAAWATRDLTRILAYVAADNVYRMTETTAPVTGHAGITERLGDWIKTSEQIEFKVLDTWAKGPMVVNHRIDRFVSNVRPLTWEGVGVFFIKDGRIREWHDYTIRVAR
jgi:limonene-1,2-epoxide hydrolase